MRAVVTDSLRVGYVGDVPDWLATDSARQVLEELGIELVAGSATDIPDVVHIASGRQARVPAGVPIVAEQGARARGTWPGRRGDAATPLTVPSIEPVDLDRFAPEEQLAEQRGRDLRMFRRFHRLAGPVLLYAGAFVPGGGLDSAVEATVLLSRTIPTLRLAAIAVGEIDEHYLDRCERLAMPLGHRGIVERDSPDDDLPLWFAVAAVACLPAREHVDQAPALLAAAAGTPVVATRPFFDGIVADGATGFLLAPDAQAPLEASLARLLIADDEREQMGRESRKWAEQHLTAGARARALGLSWLAAARTSSSQAGTNESTNAAGDPIAASARA